jgi:formamidopyrimidine-DNA glycosylase
MPELPEVETTRVGLEPLINKRLVEEIKIYQKKLRWDIPKHLPSTLKGFIINGIDRRGKYLLFRFDIGTLIMHLGMSGSIRVVNQNEELKKHDHFEIYLDNNSSIRLNDPRRFGSVLFSSNGEHKLLSSLGVEPLSDDFDSSHLYKLSRGKKQNIKTFIMDSHVVVGVGNIYACESLFMSSINPKSLAGSVSLKRYKLLTISIKDILKKAIRAGGTTLQDFSQVDGSPGYFKQTLSVYGREGKNCSSCSGKISRIVQNQRSTFYCKKCQK